VAQGHQASSHAHTHFGQQFFGGLRAVARQDLGDGVAEIKPAPVGPVTQALDFGDTRQALLQ
jgi:hypothetical protein